MKRTIFFQGSLKDKFGDKIVVDAKHYSDVVKCVDVNRPGFRQYLMDCVNQGIGFDFCLEDEYLDKQEDFLFPIGKPGDITITPIPAGSKGAGEKILAAVLLASLFFIPGTQGLLIQQAGTAAGSFTTAGLVTASIAINLALTGLQQLMAPDPATDEQAPQSYLFNGAESNVIEGDPIPVLYGELRVPGRPISFEITNRKFTKNNTYTDSQGNVILGA